MNPRTSEEILRIQRRRTDFFVNSEQSSIPLEARQRGFNGLEYFPIDSKYQFKLTLQQYEASARVGIALSNGEKVEALRAGFLEFELEKRRLTLQVYKKRLEDTEVFLPFKDKTSGKETYAAGRYVDLEVDPTDNTCVLDFNLAYNPLCAFDQGRFDCPLPPRENWLLEVEIRAREVKFHGLNDSTSLKEGLLFK